MIHHVVMLDTGLGLDEPQAGRLVLEVFADVGSMLTSGLIPVHHHDHVGAFQVVPVLGLPVGFPVELEVATRPSSASRSALFSPLTR